MNAELFYVSCPMCNGNVMLVFDKTSKRYCGICETCRICIPLVQLVDLPKTPGGF